MESLLSEIPEASFHQDPFDLEIQDIKVGVATSLALLLSFPRRPKYDTDQMTIADYRCYCLQRKGP